MNATLDMIRRVRDLMNARGGVIGVPTRYDIRLGQLMSYLRHRHYRETGFFSPI